MKRYIFLLPIFLLLVASANAYSPAKVISLLQSYDVPNGIINSLQFVNLSYSGYNYTALYSKSTGRLFFVVNLTGNYSFVLNQTSIFNIIRNYTEEKAFMAANFPKLKALLFNYTNSSNPSLHDCLVETGLSTGVSCTVQNNCLACQSVPSCNKILYETNGGTGVFGEGIAAFAVGYNNYASNMSIFNSSIATINASNAQYKLHGIESAIANIFNMTKSFVTNPIFPLPPNVTNAQRAYCMYYMNYSSATPPWYCQSIGYCGNLYYNSTVKNSIISYMYYINTLPLRDEQVMAIAKNASTTTYAYVMPILEKEKAAQFNAIMNTTLANYSSLVASASALLSHVSNATLLARLNALEGAYANFTSNYMLMNLSGENKTLALMVKSLSEAYAPLNESYANVLSLARNNTKLLLEAQMSSPVPSKGLASASFEELGINSQLSGKISNLSAMEASLISISKIAKSLYSAPLPSILRSFDGIFAKGLSNSFHLPYSTAVALVPAFSALLSFIIGMILFALLAFFYSYMKMHHKVVLNRRTKKNWRNLFLIALALVLVYVALTYVLASSANAFTPISPFQNAVKASPYIAIVINGTPNINVYECASEISAMAHAMNKTPVIVSFHNGLCSVGNYTLTQEQCFSSYAQMGVPMVVLTSSSNDSISVYSFYGSYMLANGDSAFMTACYPALLLSPKS